MQVIQELYENWYLRKPTCEDIMKQMGINEKRGWTGTFGSLDCMHLDWKNCPLAWQGQFIDKDGNYTIILEAICDQSLWIWHAILKSNNNFWTKVVNRYTAVIFESQTLLLHCSVRIQQLLWIHFFLCTSKLHFLLNRAFMIKIHDICCCLSFTTNTHVLQFFVH